MQVFFYNMERIIYRIKKYIDYKDVSVRSFERKINASSGLISAAVRKGTEIQTKWLSIIITTFPDLNSDWLLSGKGNMLKTSYAESNSGIINTGSNNGNIIGNGNNNISNGSKNKVSIRINELEKKLKKEKEKDKQQFVTEKMKTEIESLKFKIESLEREIKSLSEAILSKDKLIFFLEKEN